MSIKSYIIVIALIVIVVLSTTLLLHRHHPVSHQKKKSVAKPNLYIVDSTLVEFGDNGLIKSKITSSKVTHYDEQNTTVMVKPRILIYTAKRVPWHISAANGKMVHGTKVAYLWGNVLVHQPARPNAPETTIKTSKLTYYPDRHLAETNEEATIIRPDMQLRAKGMKANLKKGTIITKSKTRGIYVPTN
jgi:lipopolysaccharide export system protein LptC